MPEPFVELKGNVKRQAVPSIRGTVYQAWCSIDAWLRLDSPDQAIFLEGAEDFDVVGGPNGDLTVQIKLNSGSISLGNARANEALENFWALVTKEPDRVVSMHFVTTSSMAREQDADFGGLTGLDAWRAARTNPELAQRIATYLTAKLPPTSALAQFASSATVETFQEKLLNRFHWFTNQPDIDAVKRSVDNRIAVRLVALGKSLSLIKRVRVQLEARFWELVTIQPSSARCLLLGDLLAQTEHATTAYLPIPMDRMAELISAAAPGLGLLRLLVEKTPQAPSLLIPRTNLAAQVAKGVDDRRAILLTGTVYKGKTTLAQQVAQSKCPEGWWINLTDRRAEQVDNIFLALAGEIESGDCPALVIIDDLDISPSAYRVYKDSLALVLHRANVSGRGVVLTARGSTSESAQLIAIGGVDVIDIPELSGEEIQRLCIDNGCGVEASANWAVSILALTRGHPKLIQVRLAELTERRWPKAGLSDLVTVSPAAQSVRQITRQLMAESVSPSVAQLLYCMSESTVLLHRSIILTLAESLDLPNGGDVLDSLTGTWIERVEEHWHRTTALLNGSSADVWTPEKRRASHVLLHDAILNKGTLSPAEAAALLYHSFFAEEWFRVARNALRLQVLDDEDAKRKVERHLMWLPYVALDKEQLIAGNANTGGALRSLQYRVALTLDADSLPQICDRWAEELDLIDEPFLAENFSALMWTSLAIANTAKVPLRHRLNAIRGLGTFTGQFKQHSDEATARFLLSNGGTAGIPNNCTQQQLLIALSSRWIRDADALETLLTWLDKDATDEIREDFELTFGWSAVQTMGSFVQSAWATDHESITDWNPWLALFSEVEEYATRRGSLNFGREAAKAKSIVLCESLDDADGALETLVVAEKRFGKSPVLDEQRANVLFQGQDDEGVLTIWEGLPAKDKAESIQDPYAFRRAAISAWRLNRLAQSIETFRMAAEMLEPNGFELTRFGLWIDCALVELLDGQVFNSIDTLERAVLNLPAEANQEGDQRWDPLIRAGVELCRCIEDRQLNGVASFAKIEPGFASNPAQKIEKPEPGQLGRTLLLRAQSACLASVNGRMLPVIKDELQALNDVPYRYVRWTAAQGGLAMAMGTGQGLLDYLVAFESSMVDLRMADKATSIMLPDEVTSAVEELHPARWFGLIVAAAWLSGSSLGQALDAWLEWLSARPEYVDLASLVTEIRQGTLASEKSFENLAENGDKTVAWRCGAAIKRLTSTLSVEERFRIWSYLTSALVSDVSCTIQEVFNFYLAKHLASELKVLCESQFSLRHPRQSVPIFQRVVAELELGRGSLKLLLNAIHDYGNVATPEFMDRVK